MMAVTMGGKESCGPWEPEEFINVVNQRNLDWRGGRYVTLASGYPDF